MKLHSHPIRATFTGPYRTIRKTPKVPLGTRALILGAVGAAAFFIAWAVK